MKSLILLAIIFANNASAAPKDEHKIEVRLDTVVELSQEKATTLVARVAYPGLGEGAVCSLVLVAEGERRAPISALLDAIDVNPEFYGEAGPRAVVRDASTIDVHLILKTYVDGVLIVTKDGSTLASTVKRVLGNCVKVRLTAKGC